MRISIVLFTFSLMISSLGAVAASQAAISLSCTGTFSETIDSFDLEAGAGSDLISSYQSDWNAVSLVISGAADTEDTWRVEVKKIDTNWHNNLSLYVKRTSDGAGPGSIQGEELYQELTNLDEIFFSGSGDRTGVCLQGKLEGVSVNVPPDNYSTTIYYTVVDTD